jgi:hypothetical protein
MDGEDHQDILTSHCGSGYAAAGYTGDVLMCERNTTWQSTTSFKLGDTLE